MRFADVLGMVRCSGFEGPRRVIRKVFGEGFVETNPLFMEFFNR